VSHLKGALEIRFAWLYYHEWLIESQTFISYIHNEMPGLPRSRSHDGFEPPKHASEAVQWL
jgi:hypothetical protein